ncbi:MAG: 3'-5' exonuclease, partial [Gammaproteobacteria bacterium]|nr:3'-5' exonuclease [Gammaproteobacteria bacterium]
MLPPPSHTPLIALPVLVLDLETTGLDVKNDRVIQIGATGMQGDTIIGQPQLNHLLNPGMPIPATSSAIHKIFDQDVVDAPRFIEVAEHLKTAMAGRVVVGQHIAFDIAILRHEFARNGLVWHEPTILDVSQLVGALKPTLPELSLESVTDFLGVVIQDRHTAMGDCLAAAQSWIKLIALLRERDIRTLGEALTLSNQRQDLILQQIQSGWLSPPDGLVSSTLTATSRIDSYVFEHRLADVMTQPPKILESGASLRTAAKTMMKNRI